MKDQVIGAGHPGGVYDVAVRVCLLPGEEPLVVVNKHPHWALLLAGHHRLVGWPQTDPLPSHRADTVYEQLWMVRAILSQHPVQWGKLAAALCRRELRGVRRR